MKINVFLLTVSLGLFNFFGSHGQSFVGFNNEKDAYRIASPGKKLTILVSPEDHKGVRRVSDLFKQDLIAVTENEVEVWSELKREVDQVIIVGSMDQSPLISQLKTDEKFDTEDLEGKWEKFAIQKVANPFPNVKSALVICGSDKRGTIYGMFELSKQMGVSPWYWWADAPIQKHSEVYIKPGRHSKGEPDVKYRGIFINDEAPALTGWVNNTFGDFHAKFYEKVFELILRCGGNYLWPAMWSPRAFSADDPLNPQLADEYGIVMSTSHHEPLMRAHAEWKSFKGGDWNYETNKDKLKEFWKGGITRMGDYESVVTVGMRGDGDKAMSENTATELLQTIISDQRDIIAEATGKPAEETPQVWAIYKEVQDYYDKGMRLDEDIMVLFCDDNWGNVRVLPKKEDLDHKGGYGMYYHFDFVGGPVSYRWLNVTQIEHVWEQMNLSYDWGVKDLWIVNVGDIKPMELPMSFFLDFAWDASTFDAEDIPGYYLDWATTQFGANYATEIADILSLYTKYNARRTPESLKPDTYSLDHYREAERVVDEYKQLLKRSQAIYEKLPESHRSAFYQLVLSPVALCSNLNEMYVAAQKNAIYVKQGRASAGFYAEKTKALFKEDEKLTNFFHQELNGGKWNHFMAQTHIGYTNWNNPRYNTMPNVTEIQYENETGLGYVVEHGQVNNRYKSTLYSKSFSNFDPINDQTYYLEIFNMGKEELSYLVETKNDWIKLSADKGKTKLEERVYVSIDWEKVPDGVGSGELSVKAKNGRSFTIKVPLVKELPEASGFVENNGVVSIEAVNFQKKNDAKGIKWIEVPNLGRTHSAMTIEPANAEIQVPGKKTPYLEYEFTVFGDQDLTIETYVSPTLNYKKNEGLKYAIAIDDEKPQLINMNKGETKPDWEYPSWWNNSVLDHIKKIKSTHKGIKAGQHKLKIWMVDPGIVFQKFVIDAGGLKPSYLGPPESLFVGAKVNN